MLLYLFMLQYSPGTKKSFLIFLNGHRIFKMVVAGKIARIMIYKYILVN